MVVSEDPLRRNHVTLRGPRDAARVMVFVHGFGTDQNSWNAVAAAFEPDWRVVLVDHAGITLAGHDQPLHGQHRYLNLNGYADDLISVFGALGLEQAVWVGHSFGAVVCALVAIRQQHLCKRLIMLGASPRFLDDAEYRGGFTLSDLEAVYRLATLGGSDFARQITPQAMGADHHPERARAFMETIQAIPQDRLLTLLCAIFQGDHRAELARLRIPTLLIQARQDAFVPPEVACYLRDHIPGSQLVWLDADGHLPHLSHAPEVIRAIREFLDDPTLVPPGDQVMGRAQVQAGA